MKKTILTSLATMALACGAFAQGGISLDNNTAAHGITLNGAFYAGTAGIEVWFLNGNNAGAVTAVNGLAANPSGAYAQLTTSGFTLATKFTGVTITSGGFGLGDLHIPGVTPAGSSITMAIVSWQGAATSFGSAANGGVLAFFQPTADYTALPTPTSPDLTAGPAGFNTTDLAMNPIGVVPEPSSFALAGLGAAAMLIFRRRK